MTISFFPSRENMTREVDRLIASANIDMLESLCNCCLFKAFEPDHECQGCKVRIGIRLIGRGRSRDVPEGDELLGVC